MRSVYIYRMKEEKTILKPLAGIATGHATGNPVINTKIYL